jgi:hypothetical protein
MPENNLLGFIEASDRAAKFEVGYYQAQVTGIDSVTGQLYLQQIDDEDGLPDEAPYTYLAGFVPQIGDWVWVARSGRTSVVLGTLVRDAPLANMFLPGGHSFAYGSGDPNTVVTGKPGSFYFRTDFTNDPGDLIYVKSDDGVDTTGWVPIRFLNRRRTRRDIVVYAGASTSTSFVTQGFQNGPTMVAAGGFSNADASTGAFLSLLTSTVANNVASVVAGTNSGVRPDWTPLLSIGIRSPLTITAMRYWAGFFAATPATADLPTVACAGFRFSTSGSDVNFMTYTNDGTGTGVLVDTGTTLVTNTAYDLAIALDGNQAVFYINGREVSRHTTDLPPATTTIDYGIYLTTLDTTAKQLRWGRITIESEP